MRCRTQTGGYGATRPSKNDVENKLAIGMGMIVKEGTKRGQVSMEFMAYFAFLLIMFAAFGPLFFNQSVRVENMKSELVADRISTLIEREVSIAVRFGDGYKRNFTIPNKISGSNYTIEIISDMNLLNIDWGKSSVTRQIIGEDFNGSLKPGKNHIKNSDGEIVFNG